MPKSKTEGKRVAPWCTGNTIDFIIENFQNMNQGATYLLSSAPALYRQTLIGLKGKFTDGELKLMIDVMNGTMLTAEWPGATILGNVVDGIALDNLDGKWEINGADLKEKVENLYVFQLHILEIWANGFWYGGGHEAKTPIETYIKPLL